MYLLLGDTCCCRVQEQQGSKGSALAVMQLAPSAGQPGDRAGLGQEVAALTGLLHRFAPQLDELAGLKQQMGRLVSALQSGKLHHGRS